MVINTTWSNPATAKASGGLDFTTGDTIDETTLDRYASNLYHLGGTAGHIGARVFHGSNQSIANNTTTILAFDSERYDLDPNGAIHDTSTNNSRLQVRTNGKYLVGATVQFATDATGIRQVVLLVDATIPIAAVQHSAASADTTQVSVSTVYDLTTANYVECRVFQTSGGALNVEAASAYSPEFYIAKV